MNLDKCFCTSDDCPKMVDCDRHHSEATKFFEEKPHMIKPISQSNFYEVGKDCEVFEPKEVT